MLSIRLLATYACCILQQAYVAIPFVVRGLGADALHLQNSTVRHILSTIRHYTYKYIMKNRYFREIRNSVLCECLR